MTTTKRTDTEANRLRDREAALAALDHAQAVNDGDVDALPSPKPLGRRTKHIAAVLGGVSEKTVTNLLKAPKRPGVPKLEGWRIGKIWLASDEQIAKYVEECKAVERGEKIE